MSTSWISRVGLGAWAVSLGLVACDGGGDKSDAAGGAGGGGGAAADCGTKGNGKLSVDISGLPKGLDADVSMSKPSGGDETLTASTSRPSSPAGTYSFTPNFVYDQDTLVRSIHRADAPSDICLDDGGQSDVSVAYELHPASNRIWVTNQNGEGSLLSFRSSLLAASGDDVTPTDVDTANNGHEIVFDREGNLWTTGGTVGDANILRYAFDSLGSESPSPDREINLGIECIPAMRALAFDPSGSLWASVCGDEIRKLSPADLADSGDVTAAVVLSGVTNNGDLAFDGDGNLWVVSDGKVLRFDADQLAASGSEPQATVSVLAPADGAGDLAIDNLAFDSAGNLWCVSGDTVVEVAKADLEGTGDLEVPVVVSIAIDVAALPSRPAFDDEGGLWLTLSAGSFGRLAPSQLGVSSDAGSPTTPDTIIKSSKIGSSGVVAFFPADPDLPLYHALPVP